MEQRPVPSEVEELDRAIVAEAKLRAQLQSRYRPVVIWPDKKLEHPCYLVPADQIAALSEPPNTLSGSLRDLMDRMAATMTMLKGAGLAAPQLGEECRVIAVRVRHLSCRGIEVLPGQFSGCGGGADCPFCHGKPVAPTEEIVCIINPDVVERTGTQQSHEGCLSLPGIQLEVERASFVKVKGFGYDGRPLEMAGDGLLAAALQHEVDHLDGVVIAHKVSVLRRQLVRTRLEKAKRRGLHYPTQDEVAGKTRKERTT